MAPVNSKVCIGVVVAFICINSVAVNVDKNTIMYNNSFSFLKKAYIDNIIVITPIIVISICITIPF